MNDTEDLRNILSGNIKTVRNVLHISQAKLAESAEISLSYLTDIERCKTWVSDRTLNNIAHALNMEAYELLIPQNTEKKTNGRQDALILRRMAALIKTKKSQLRKNAGEIMDDLIMEIIKLHRE